MAKLNFILVAALTLGAVSAVTEEEIKSLKETALPIFKSCAEEYDTAKESTSPSTKNGNIPVLDSCFYACFFKKIAVINEAGLFDPDMFLEKNKKHIKGEEDLVKVADIGKTCSSVNEQTVSDAAKGCERSKLLLFCLIKENDNLIPFSPPASAST